MPKSAAGLLFIPCALMGLLTGSAGCSSGPKFVSRTDVANQIKERMRDAAGNKPDSVTCPNDLQPTVGATLTCTMTLHGQRMGVEVTVTSVEDGNVNFDMETVIDRDEIATQTG